MKNKKASSFFRSLCRRSSDLNLGKVNDGAGYLNTGYLNDGDNFTHLNLIN